MPDAELVIRAVVKNGGLTRASELAGLQHAAELAIKQAREAGGAKLNGVAKSAFDGPSASWNYTAVSSK